MDISYDLSILVRVRNERDALARLLTCLDEQLFDGSFEVVVLDNESDDDSGQVALAHGARVFSLPRHLFTYGRAINIGINRCRADFIILLSAHVQPQEKNFLQLMVDNLRSCPKIDAVYCLQIPKCFNYVGKAEMLRFSMFPSHSCVIDEDFVRQRIEDGFSLYRASYFSNSACILRREATCLCRMRDLPYAEENAFALDIIVRGRSVAYQNTLAVYYEGPVSSTRLYEQSKRQTIAEKLINERYGLALGLGHKNLYTTLSAFVDVILIPITLIRIIYRVIFNPRYRIGSRALMYDIFSVHGILGRLVGVLTWRQFRKTMEVDLEKLQEADAATRQMHS